MNRAVLQIPIDKSLRIAAEKTAEEQGFSSLQEAVRVFLNQFAQKAITVNFQPTVQLSPKAIKRYNKIITGIESGKTRTNIFTNVDEMTNFLTKSDHRA